MSTESATPATAPMDLKRITTEMHDLEDRLQLVGELASGGTVVFWLTQRLVKRLVPHLLSWLQPAATGVTAAAPLPDYHTDAIQSFAQQAALAQLPEQPPVQAAQQDSKCLIDSIDVVRTPEIIARTESHAAHGPATAASMAGRPARPMPQGRMDPGYLAGLDHRQRAD